MIANSIVFLSAVFLLLVSVVAMVQPGLARAAIGRFASTDGQHFAELAVRIIVGAAFLWASDGARLPVLFLAIGAILIVTSVVLAALPRHWHQRWAVFWSGHLPGWVLYPAAALAVWLALIVMRATV